jgi:hypothetical protein
MSWQLLQLDGALLNTMKIKNLFFIFLPTPEYQMDTSKTRLVASIPNSLPNGKVNE